MSHKYFWEVYGAANASILLEEVSKRPKHRVVLLAELFTTEKKY
jgi:hypothetical protein